MTTKGLQTKLIPLSKTETAQTFEHFRENLLLNLLNDDRFKAYVEKVWAPESTDANCGFTDDPNTVAVADRKTALQKKVELKLMLGTVASFIPVISRNFIVGQTTCLNDIWNRLRSYYGFKKNGSRVIGLAEYSLKAGQSYEDLWEEMYTHMEECLMDPSDSLQHLNSKPTVKEALTPTLLNMLVVLWLQAIDPGLLLTIKERFTKELSSCTLLSIREEVSEAIPSLVSSPSIGRLNLQSAHNNRRQPSASSREVSTKTFTKSCCLCKAAGRPHGHFLSKCLYVPQADRRFMARARMIYIEEEAEEEGPDHTPVTTINRAAIETSPALSATVGQANVSIILDSGAHTNIMDLKEAQRLKLTLRPSIIRRAIQADGLSPMEIIGEFSCELQHGHHSLKCEGLVVNNLGCPIIGGVPFHSANNISVDMQRRLIVLNNCCKIPYGGIPPEVRSSSTSPVVMIMRVSTRTCILPGESMSFELPTSFRSEDIVCVEPRQQSPSSDVDVSWPTPEILQIQEGRISVTNATNLPLLLTKNQHVFNVRRTGPGSEPAAVETAHTKVSVSTSAAVVPLAAGAFYSESVSLDPDNRLSKELRDSFQDILRSHDEVFKPGVGAYNGASGPYEAHVNMGHALPPQRKGRLPLYSPKDKVTLQQKFDELYAQGVFARPEEIGVCVEYVNPSFLIRKQNGDWRLVTAFAEVAQYCKPQPSLLPSTDDTLRAIAQWRHLVKTDLAQAYYQIPASKDSMKFLGVCTPFKGVYVYKRCAMGMPGSETALEELLCRVLGDLIAKGNVCKIADDLYCGANTPTEVVKVWTDVLQRLHENGLRLSTHKTVICPSKTTVLGWIWNDGRLSASSHRVSALEGCDPPTTVKGLRSFNGAVKFLSKVLPNHVDILNPLEAAVAGRKSSEKMTWTDALMSAFRHCQTQLTKTKTITIPRSEDELQIVTDASSSKLGLAATLFVIRDGKPLIAGFFNAKLKSHHTNWLPCELEALCIGTAVKFFAPYLTQSAHRCTVFTDSRPCVQAYNRLCQGKFSTSARVLTFISVLSNYGIAIEHIPGTSNTVADYTSRNPVVCPESSCQICKYVADTAESVVRAVAVTDVAADKTLSMYTSRPAWYDIQRSCEDLRRVHAHLSQGTRPSRKLKQLRDVRRYLNEVTISHGLLVHRKKADRHRPGQEKIVVPRSVIHGIVTAFHLKLNHPSRAQMLKTLKRSFYAINMAEVIEQVHQNCHVCTSVSDLPTVFTEQSTSPAPDTIASQFSADCIRRCKQVILVVREKVTGFTLTKFLDNERAETLRTGFLELTSLIRTPSSPPIVIRVDPAPAFQSLQKDRVLQSYGITLQLGDPKNINKNPIAERAIRELHQEFRKLSPEGGPISSTNLAIATSRVNSLIRESQLSSLEMWTQRDQFTNKQLPISDQQLIDDRQNQRLASHASSARYKARGRTTPRRPEVRKGNLVYLLSDRDKTKARDKYLVSSVNYPLCNLQKFVGNQLRSKQYSVKISDCILIRPSGAPPNFDNFESDSSDEEDELNHEAEEGAVIDNIVDNPNNHHVFDNEEYDDNYFEDNIRDQNVNVNVQAENHGQVDNDEQRLDNLNEHNHNFNDVDVSDSDDNISNHDHDDQSDEEDPPDLRPERARRLPKHFDGFVMEDP